MIAVEKVLNAVVEKCESCKSPLIPTTSGFVTCPRGCGKLLTTIDADEQKLSLLVTGEIDGKFYGDRETEIQKDADFIRSLPVAQKTKRKKLVAWRIGEKLFKRTRILKSRDDIANGETLAVVTPKSRMRVAAFQEFST